ncbi:MAG: hypothetical protein ILO42_00705 [Clostridia bacterium]|nr:hypothetical protein [Clostridia bacterium]
MKRLVVYYSLTGNTAAAAEKIASALGADIVKLETKKAMPKSFAARMIVGGGQVVFGYMPELLPLGRDLAEYGEIILGSPIWNSKGVPAVNAFLKDEAVAAKVTSLFFLSAGGDTQKGLEAITGKLPNLKRSVSLLDEKNEDSRDNAEKIAAFVKEIAGQDSGSGLTE